MIISYFEIWVHDMQENLRQNYLAGIQLFKLELTRFRIAYQQNDPRSRDSLGRLGKGKDPSSRIRNQPLPELKLFSRRRIVGHRCRQKTRTQSWTRNGLQRRLRALDHRCYEVGPTPTFLV